MDRLTDLTGELAAAGETEVMIDFSDVEEDATEGVLRSFCETTQRANGHLSIIRANTLTLRELHAEKLETADLAAASTIGQKIKTLTAETQESIKGVKEVLDQLRAQTAELKATEESAHANTAIIKMEENQLGQLQHAFMTVLKDYQALQSDTVHGYHEQTTRRIKMRYMNEDGTTIDDSRAEDLARDVMEHGDENAIFQQSRETLAIILENCDDIRRIEQSMRDLHQIFSDLAVLVDEQGDVMNQILSNVEAANTYVEKGRTQLKAAKKQAKSCRRLLKIALVIALLVFGLLLAVILGYTVPV